MTSKSLPDLTSSVEDVSSWTDNEDQEPDGEEDEGPGSSSVQGAVSVPLVSPAAVLENDVSLKMLKAGSKIIA